jgi:hypothetical protein
MIHTKAITKVHYIQLSSFARGGFYFNPEANNLIIMTKEKSTKNVLPKQSPANRCSLFYVY